MEFLSGIGFQIDFKPQGSFFIFAELHKDYALGDVMFWLLNNFYPLYSGKRGDILSSCHYFWS